MVEFVDDLAQEKGVRKKWCVMWDNASYHRSRVVTRALHRHRIPIIQNIAYRPDFMGIEQFWGQAKRAYKGQVNGFQARGESWDQ